MEVLQGDGVQHQVEARKQNPCIGPYIIKVLQGIVLSRVDCIIHRPVCLVGKLNWVQQGGLMSFRWARTCHYNVFMSTDVRVTGL